jgi:hypothetical protein
MKQLMFQRMNVRFVECTGGKVIPREEFLGFVRILGVCYLWIGTIPFSTVP